MITLNKVASLQQQSQDALSIFEKTVTRLNKINDSILKAKQARIAKMDKLQNEIDTLVVHETKNDKLATKLINFLED